jgi:hypothetical protein
MDKRQKEMLSQMAPVFGFVAIMFISEAFSWMPATKIVWATLVSLIIYFIMVADLKERSKEILSIKKMNFFSGILTLIFILLFASGFLDWYRVLPQFQRLSIILLILLIYFIVLFRAMRIYLEYLEIIKRKGK